MSNGAYIGSGETAHKVAGMYIGVDGLARKVTKGYIGDANGVVRLFYTALVPFEYLYTGSYIENEVTVDNMEYIVLTITGSGTFTANRPIAADIWLCGGGGSGGGGPNSSGSGGGGGGYTASANVQLSGSTACVIGAAEGGSSIGAILANAGSIGDVNGGDGGSGGGGSGGGGSGGSGAGTSTVPAAFGLSDAHCAGGGGGAHSGSSGLGSGGAGGTNGTNGYDGTTSGAASGVGGTFGGGGGGLASGMDSMRRGNDATFYGSGGGGTGMYNGTRSMGGSGYQGVIYVRWKKEDAA